MGKKNEDQGAMLQQAIASHVAAQAASEVEGCPQLELSAFRDAFWCEGEDGKPAWKRIEEIEKRLQFLEGGYDGGRSLQEYEQECMQLRIERAQLRYEEHQQGFLYWKDMPGHMDQKAHHAREMERYAAHLPPDQITPSDISRYRQAHPVMKDGLRRALRALELERERPGIGKAEIHGLILGKKEKTDEASKTRKVDDWLKSGAEAITDWKQRP